MVSSTAPAVTAMTTALSKLKERQLTRVIIRCSSFACARLLSSEAAAGTAPRAFASSSSSSSSASSPPGFALSLQTHAVTGLLAFAGGCGAAATYLNLVTESSLSSPPPSQLPPPPGAHSEGEKRSEDEEIPLMKLEGHPRTRVQERKQQQEESESTDSENKASSSSSSSSSSSQAAAAEAPKSSSGAVRQVWFGFKGTPRLDEGGILKLYDVKNQMGEGSFGNTYLALDKGNGGREVAMKILPKSRIACADSIEDVDREVEIMKQLSGHENIVTFFEAFEDERNVYIVMEVCKGGELFDAIQEQKGKYTEKGAAETIRQILMVLAHCHLNGIVYCDVKPENFLYLDEEHKVLKAIDFGLSRHFTPLGRALRKPRGTAYYVAPEVMRFEYGPEADMWSAGVIAYLLLTGTVPFHGETEKEILKEVMAGKLIDFESGPWRKVSDQAKSFVKGLLERDAGLRFTAVQALNHPWLKGEASGDCVIDAAAVSSLHAFANYGRMRKLALRAVAGVIAESGFIDDLRLQFQTMTDSNLISIEELQEALQKTTWKHTDKEIKNLLESIHCYTYGPFRNQSTGAKIDYHEFLAATMSIRQLEKYIQNEEHWKDILKKAFDFFDKDGDGLISCEDLRKCLHSDRGNVEKLVDECMLEADIDKSGSITFEEFVDLLHLHDPSSSSRYGYVKTPSRKGRR